MRVYSRLQLQNASNSLRGLVGAGVLRWTRRRAGSPVRCRIAACVILVELCTAKPHLFIPGILGTDTPSFPRTNRCVLAHAATTTVRKENRDSALSRETVPSAAQKRGLVFGEHGGHVPLGRAVDAGVGQFSSQCSRYACARERVRGGTRVSLCGRGRRHGTGAWRSATAP